MSNATVSRIGQINNTGDVDALFLKKYAGEVLTAFRRAVVTEGLHQTRNIENGKSASFPVIGTSDASYHIPGQDIMDASNGFLNQIANGERIINIDGLLISPVFIASIDEAKAHYEYRKEYSFQSGRALAHSYDRNVLQTAILAARATANIPSDSRSYGGDVIDGTDIAGLNAPTGEVLAEAIYEASVKLDEKDVPEEDRYCVLRPREYSLLARNKDLQNKDLGGHTLYLENKIPHVAGVKILKSNNVPSTVITAKTGESNTYDGDFTDTIGPVFHKSAVGTVRLLQLALEDDYSVAHQGTLMVAKYSVGHGILRPEAAIELSKNNV